MDQESNTDVNRAKRVSVAGWTIGVSALFLSVTLANAPTWPVAFGVAAIAAMLAGVAFLILKAR